jgi:hypothetical protein
VAFVALADFAILHYLVLGTWPPVAYRNMRHMGSIGAKPMLTSVCYTLLQLG